MPTPNLASEEVVNTIEMPEYACHKRVTAAKIKLVNGCWLEFFDMLPVHAEEAWIERFQPVAGGYLVRYPDGYFSFSPAAPFEDGYTRITV